MLSLTWYLYLFTKSNDFSMLKETMVYWLKLYLVYSAFHRDFLNQDLIQDLVTYI